MTQETPATPWYPLVDGSSLSESRRSPSAGVPTGAQCVSVGGSTAATRDDGGFCLASDLSTSIMGIAKFAFANGLPAAGLQFLTISPLRMGARLVDHVIPRVPVRNACRLMASTAATGMADGFAEFGPDTSSTASRICRLPMTYPWRVCSISHVSRRRPT